MTLHDLRSPAAVPSGRIGLRTLIFIRWIGIAGQAAALVIVHYGLGYDLPLIPCFGAVALSAAINLALTFFLPRTARLNDIAASLSLGYDLLQLTALLYLTGGLRNPFAILLLAPVTVSATALSFRATLMLTLAACGLAAGLAWLAPPAPWHNIEFQTGIIYLIALVTAFLVTIIFVAIYVFSVAEEGRRLSSALAATQLALEQEQRSSALGALAAAAAHELGSPLSTIALVAKELSHNLPPDSEAQEDVKLLLTEAGRCRDILTELARKPDQQAADPFRQLPLSALIESALAPYRRTDITVRMDLADTMSSEPLLPNRADIVHGLGLLLQNAIQFARTRVQVTMAQDPNHIQLQIADDGPGIDPDMIGRLGEPYRSGGAQGRDGNGFMGLGVFVAKTLLRQSGGEVAFANGPNGAIVTVRWPQSPAA